MSWIIPIDEPSRVAEVRRASAAAANSEGLDEDAAGRLAIIATEAATNLLKHAGGGEIHVSSLSLTNRVGVEILAIDRGPGIGNLEHSLSDGVSTTATAGSGLGAIRRIAQEFDIHSERGKGTILMAQVWNKSGRATGALSIGVVNKPVGGESVSGDSWAVRFAGRTVLFMVADGLGHGQHAADASRLAISLFLDASDAARPADLLTQSHNGLRGTRGAAVSIAELDLDTMKVTYVGIGNISGSIVSASKLQHMVSHNGTVGHTARHFQEFTYVLPENSLIVMHSDGLTTNWNLPPALRRHHPSVIAALLYRDSSRGRDDACVLVARREIH